MDQWMRENSSTITKMLEAENASTDPLARLVLGERSVFDT
jgi:hypothetical protein